ncbi:thermophilic desulfurizing enzyme family protein [Ophiostoma piceae UAMH 11346]|uniref:Thermophilic desulfurizing enzyme family protein n=1 Tax=Ophiostoma piceae (strain UAMH 11346) TaxID=1262450 RepID=S3BV77_OPHP1|nr:thermophilic desulfurizing enzyme family protein [Ophiostoma piceae UAMH 11346]
MSDTTPASSDPSIYAEYQSKWSTLPADSAGWIQRANDVADVLKTDAAAREKANKSPKAEVALLKHSGLLKVLGPAKYGGGAQPWDVAYRVIREIAKGDGSIGMLLGYHLIWAATPNVFGSPEQADRIQKIIITNNYYIGGAVNPRDNDLTIKPEGDKLVFNGLKNFSTGGVISDLTVLEGVVAGSTDHIFALVPTNQPGIKFKHNWDNVGLRLTESGGVQIQDVPIPWEDALGWDVKTKKPDPNILGVPLASIFLPLIQLNFANFYIGIAWGALEFAKDYTRKNTRPWPFGGDPKEKVDDEFYILQTYGNFFAHLRAATALADRANLEAARLYTKYVNSGDRAKFTAAERGEFAEWVASVKVVATDTSLRVTSGVFEVTGSRSTAAKVGLDRFWRDVRTHTLHDPVSYKNRELGRYYLLDELPEPTWYT